MATTPIAGSGDPSVLRQIELQNAALTTRPQLTSAPSVTGTSGTPTSTASTTARALAPVVSGAETLYPLSTATTSSNAITITSSISNDTGDVTTIYSAGGRITSTAINQTINQFTAVDSGVSQVIAGNGVSITSTGENGKGVVTVSSSTTFGNIVSVNLTGSNSNVLYGNGVFAPVTGGNGSYSDSNVVSLLSAFGSNTITTTGNVSVGNIIGNSTIDIDNRVSGNAADIRLFSADDIVLQARDRTLGSTSEGGDINIFAGDSAEDGDSSGGDVVIEAGAGGAANVDFGGSGGFIRVEAGRGGAAIGNSGYSAENGGSLTLSAGDAGDNNSNIDLGAAGGDVFIESGYSTGNTESGGDIVLTTGTGGQNGASGNVQINIPGYGLTTGGTWTFDGNGDINIPANATSFQTGRIQSANGYPTLLAYGTGDGGGPELMWANTDNVNDLGNANVIRNTMFINDTGLYVGMNENNVAGTFSGGWNFTPNGTTIFPTLEVDIHNGGNQTAQTLQFGDSTQQAIITGPTPSANTNAQRLIIQGQRGLGTGEGGDVYLWAGDTDGTNGGDIKIYAGDADNVAAGSGGYINLAGGDGFDNGGAITLNGGYSANGYGGQISITGGQGQIDGGPASITGGYATAGNGGAVNITGGTSSVGPSAYGNVEIGSGIYGWSFNNEGNLAVPGAIVGSANANLTVYSNAGAHSFTFADDGTFYSPDNAVVGGTRLSIGPGANTLSELEGAVLVASSNSIAFIQGVIENVSDNGSADWVAQGHYGNDNGGYVNFGFNSSGHADANHTISGPGDGYVIVDGYANGQAPLPTGGNLVLATSGQGLTKDIVFATGGFMANNEFARISDANNALELTRANSDINLSGGGNVTANNFIGNGDTLSNVAIQETGSWTLASGVNTVSLSVPGSGTYSIWVNGNIPNGIITYTATAVVTNPNVPVLGEQYGWFYELGNALVLTSLPDQFVGTQGAISNATPYLGNTANVFTFGITNNSGNAAVVNYGYTKL